MNGTAGGSLPICRDLEGNPDLYGIGIRLGVYLSWFATLLANNFITSRIDDVSDTNTLFVVANFAAVASHSYGGELNVVDVYIVLAIFVGYIFGGWSLSGIRLGRIYYTAPVDDKKNLGCNEALETTLTKRIRLRKAWVVELNESFSQIGIFIRLALALAVAGYGVWFAYAGAPRLAPAECSPTIFLFGRQHFFGAVLVFLKVLTAVILLLIGLLSLPVVVVFLRAAVLNFIGVLGCVLCYMVCKEEGDGRMFTGETDAERAAEEKQWQREDRKDFWTCFAMCCWILVSNLNTSRKEGPAPEPTKLEQQRDPAPEHIFHALRWGEHSPITVLGCVGLIVILWTIIVIEMTIAYNGMPEINQLIVTSQLIPFVVGLGLILTVLHRLFFEYVDPKKREERHEARAGRRARHAPAAPGITPDTRPQAQSHAHEPEQGSAQIVSTQPVPVAPMSAPATPNPPSASASHDHVSAVPDQCLLKRTASGRAYIVDKQARTTRWADDPPGFSEHVEDKLD